MLKDGWDLRFLSLAKHISTWSKDPSTKVGSVLVDENKRVVSMGYNGFPAQIRDDADDYLNRDLKLKKVVHAEANAIAKLAKSNESGNNSVAFITHAPCMECAKLLVQSGIIEVYYLQEYRDTSGLNFLDQSNVKVHKVKLKERKDIDFGTEL